MRKELGLGDMGHWARSTRRLREDLARELPPDRLAELHRIHPARHFAVTARQVVLGVAFGAGALLLEPPWLWIPSSLGLGLVLFDFTVLLHEVIHRLVWPRSRRRELAYAILGWLYALPSGISPSQFTRWHLDHHRGLGTEGEDPKRHRLSPRRNARWLKALYFTPALFFIYFRAAAKEVATYPEALRRRIRFERAASLGLHMALALGIWHWAGDAALVRVYLVPYLVGFPLAFGINRLGQHYDVDPSDPARWATRMRRSLPWDLLFLNSGYHLEHHYFPGVPLYNLRRLNRALEPFFLARGIPERSYLWLLWHYVVLNREPHTRWA